MGNDPLKKMALMAFGMLIVFVTNAIFSIEPPEQTMRNEYPASPYSSEMILITSAGQSTDTYIFHDIANDLHLNNQFMPEADTYDLSAYSALVIVVGYSEVGMELNEVTFDEELKRVEKLIHHGQAELMPIIVTYLGGDERRDEMTDKLLLSLSEKADYIIMTTSNADSYFIRAMTREGEIPITTVSTVKDLNIPLKSIFN
jgi:hypothetical protein